MRKRLSVVDCRRIGRRRKEKSSNFAWVKEGRVGWPKVVWFDGDCLALGFARVFP